MLRITEDKVEMEVLSGLEQRPEGVKELVSILVHIPSYDPKCLGKTKWVAAGALEQILTLFIEQTEFLALPFDLTVFKGIKKSGLGPESIAVLTCSASEVIVTQLAWIGDHPQITL
ncbi:hypothetical protein C8J56DRAFT_1050420 [Mycena floridula]|nr:hypothetical protein C8J56DRAFT_1050420 [Mycena floridula]